MANIITLLLFFSLNCIGQNTTRQMIEEQAKIANQQALQLQIKDYGKDENDSSPFTTSSFHGEKNIIPTIKNLGIMFEMKIMDWLKTTEFYPKKGVVDNGDYVGIVKGEYSIIIEKHKTALFYFYTHPIGEQDILFFPLIESLEKYWVMDKENSSFYLVMNNGLPYLFIITREKNITSCSLINGEKFCEREGIKF